MKSEKKTMPKITDKSLEELRSKITDKVKGLDTIPKMQKETVRIVARHYIRTKYPEKLEEFDNLYESIYNTLSETSRMPKRLAASKETTSIKTLLIKQDLLKSIILITNLLVMKLKGEEDITRKNYRQSLNRIVSELIDRGFNSVLTKQLSKVSFNLLIK